MSQYIIRQMQESDIPQVIEIDREAFPTQWPRPTYSTFKQELRNRLAYYIVAAKPQEKELPIQNVVKQTLRQRLHKLWQSLSFNRSCRETIQEGISSADYIVGIAGFWIMVDEAHITTIAVRKAYRRQGIGEFLLISIIDMAIQMNAKIVTLEVRVSNIPAQALYEKYGFQRVGLRRAYYTDNGEDALLMSTESITSEAFQTNFQQLKRNHLLKWGQGFSDTITLPGRTISKGRSIF